MGGVTVVVTATTDVTTAEVEGSIGTAVAALALAVVVGWYLWRTRR